MKICKNASCDLDLFPAKWFQFIERFEMRHTFGLLALIFHLTLWALPRDQTERNRFVRENPCPANGKTKGPCPGYEVDHKKALMNGGEDKPRNMQWQKNSDHKEKTQKDIHECKKSSSCLHRGLKRKNNN